VIVGQHQRHLEFLSNLPFVDLNRIGFYGLSYGGRSAMIIPAILEEYALSISSGHFTDWAWKRNDIYDEHCGMYGPQYQYNTFNIVPTMNYMEMAYLIAPRPFMVERGLEDHTAKPAGVPYAYYYVQNLYNKLGIPDRTKIEYNDGGHRIYLRGTNDFLCKYLKWVPSQ
jgi:cephalosporin-C deacetylase-like acetyl esterase